MRLRGRALRADSSAGVGDVLPLHAVSTPYRHRRLGQRPRRPRHVPGRRGRLRAWKPDGGAEKWFCGDCGSALFSRTGDDDPQIGVRLGAFDADPGIRPVAHQFVAYAASWEPIPEDGLPRFPERRVAD
jgi:Glutathione-dependent formaldehyde-activating enzyme